MEKREITDNLDITTGGKVRIVINKPIKVKK